MIISTKKDERAGSSFLFGYSMLLIELMVNIIIPLIGEISIKNNYRKIVDRHVKFVVYKDGFDQSLTSSYSH